MSASQKTEQQKEALVEAALFLSGRFLSLQELVVVTGINPLTLRELLESLQARYQSHPSLAVVCRQGRYKMDVKQGYSWLVNKLATGSTEFSKAEQETLAIVAYKQPITQALVVKIRGNKAYDHIKHLIAIGLIKTKKAGRTLELRLAEEFYDYFGVKRGKEEKEEKKGKEEEKENVV